MHIFQSFASVALLLPALLASAYPHSHERRMPSLVDNLELFTYPAAEATPFLILEIGAKTVVGDDFSYNVSYNGTPAIAMTIKEEVYDEVVRALTAARTLLASGQDAQKQVWVIVSRSSDHHQRVESPEGPDDSSSSANDEEEDYGGQYNN